MAPTAPVSMQAWLKTARVLWLSLFLAPVFYILILVMRAHQDHPTGGSGLDLPPLTQLLLFGGVAAVTATLSAVFPRRALTASIRRLNLRVDNQAGEPIGSFRESAPVRRVVADPEAAVRAVMPSFQQTFILGMALAEAVALMGLMIAYVGNPMPMAAPFFAVCWILMLTKFPRVTSIIRAIEAVTGAECRLGS